MDVELGFGGWVYRVFISGLDRGFVRRVSMESGLDIGIRCGEFLVWVGVRRGEERDGEVR